MDDLIMRVAALEKFMEERNISTLTNTINMLIDNNPEMKALEQKIARNSKQLGFLQRKVMTNEKLGTEDDMDAWYDSNMLDKPEEKDGEQELTAFDKVDPGVFYEKSVPKSDQVSTILEPDKEFMVDIATTDSKEQEPPLATSGFIFVDLHKKILKKQREEFLADLEKLPIEYVRWVGKHTIAAINDETPFGETQSAMIFLPEITKLIEKWGRLKE